MARRRVCSLQSAVRAGSWRAVGMRVRSPLPTTPHTQNSSGHQQGQEGIVRTQNTRALPQKPPAPHSPQKPDRASSAPEAWTEPSSTPTIQLRPRSSVKGHHEPLLRPVPDSRLLDTPSAPVLGLPAPNPVCARQRPLLSPGHKMAPACQEAFPGGPRTGWSHPSFCSGRFPGSCAETHSLSPRTAGMTVAKKPDRWSAGEQWRGNPCPHHPELGVLTHSLPL